jgi:hypothetical protein
MTYSPLAHRVQGVINRSWTRIDAGDETGAVAEAREAAQLAAGTGDFAAMLWAGLHLWRLLEFEAGARLLSEAGMTMTPGSLPEWDGQAREGAALAIVQRGLFHVGSVLRAARLAPLAAERVGRCVLIAEARLVPLLRRSFPQIEVREGGLEDGAAFTDADFAASYETLVLHLGRTPAELIAGFTPLVPDPALTAGLHARYRRDGEGPVIGISWASTNEDKDLPSLEDWARVIARMPARFVSVQYGDTAGDLKALRSLAGRDIVHDTSIDPMADLDAAAAQLAAMDGVLSISNTTVHMSGALGVPTAIILDDRRALLWPPLQDAYPFYPAADLVHRRGRPWEIVFEQAADLLFRRTGTRVDRNEAVTQAV